MPATLTLFGVTRHASKQSSQKRMDRGHGVRKERSKGLWRKEGRFHFGRGIIKRNNGCSERWRASRANGLSVTSECNVWFGSWKLSTKTRRQGAGNFRPVVLAHGLAVISRKWLDGGLYLIRARWEAPESWHINKCYCRMHWINEQNEFQVCYKLQGM